MNVLELNRVIAARAIENHMLEIRFSDGYVGKLNLAPALWGPIFEPLKNEEYFRQFRIEDDTIRWPNNADFCPDVLRYWSESGSVQSQEETDSHFARQLTEPAAS
jgi:Protein of unknown function (DUF2442)